MAMLKTARAVACWCLAASSALLLLSLRPEATTRVHQQAYVTPPPSPSSSPSPYVPAPPKTIDEVITESRARIAEEVATLTRPPSKTRSVIVTTWRSGSTFLGAVLNAIPANYYHYEPLLSHDIVQIRGPPFADAALSTLKSLLACDYSRMDAYLEYGAKHTWLFTHNERLWERCQQHPHLCWNSTFLSRFCRLFPFQSMKIVRLRLKLAEELIPEAKILLLVRDPRGTLQSRRHREWCPGRPDCDKASLLCADMVSDYVAAVRLAKLYPDRFMALRYEDLSLDPYGTVAVVLQFFGLEFHQAVKDFLDTHTKLDLGGVSSTFRNSKSAPFHWTKDLDFDDVWTIQNECSEAMFHWGYNMAHNQSHLTSKEFNPLREYNIAF